LAIVLLFLAVVLLFLAIVLLFLAVVFLFLAVVLLFFDIARGGDILVMADSVIPFSCIFNIAFYVKQCPVSMALAHIKSSFVLQRAIEKSVGFSLAM
jgi:hypothetical protein